MLGPPALVVVPEPPVLVVPPAAVVVPPVVPPVPPPVCKLRLAMQALKDTAVTLPPGTFNTTPLSGCML
jgi:hypothetical protein